MAARDSNGNIVTRSVRRVRGGWAVTVWSGYNPATTIRTYTYETRAQARDGDISDDIGQRGRVR